MKGRAVMAEAPKIPKFLTLDYVGEHKQFPVTHTIGDAAAFRVTVMYEDGSEAVILQGPQFEEAEWLRRQLEGPGVG